MIKEVYLREATIRDSELLYKWVNDPDVRINSINNDYIIWQNHLSWFNNKIFDPKVKIFILTDGRIELGQIRIEYNSENWIIDYSIDSKYRGKGLGITIVNLLILKFPNFKLLAIVNKGNSFSIKVFLKLGFKKIESDLENFDFFINHL